MSPRHFFSCLLVFLACWTFSGALAAQLRLPGDAVVGQPLAVCSNGEGDGKLLLIGPGQVVRRDIHLGNELTIPGEDIRSAGRWIAILRSGGHDESSVFWVRSGTTENLIFRARPSRVPVAQRDAILGLALIFDKFHNLVLQPTPVQFSLSVNNTGTSHAAMTREGIAEVTAASGAREGAAQFVASAGSASVRRVVRQVASDPCNLRMHVVQRTEKTLVVATDPIRDCTGNAVPDGAIVTFMETDPQGKSTVDARIKKGVARAELPASNGATIVVASGVVLGNELRVGSER